MRPHIFKNNCKKKFGNKKLKFYICNIKKENKLLTNKKLKNHGLHS